MGAGRIYVGQLDGQLKALDQTTGAVLWSVEAERWQDGYTITAAPLYYDGLVITGFAGGEMGIRGRIKAFDAEDGSLVWTFYTVPGPGEFGHETWSQDNELWMHGGAPACFIFPPVMPPQTPMVHFAPATTCSRPRSWRLMSIRVNTAGTSRKCIMISGITIHPIP
jgi:alcohol dehydrogenase (cytochrome c)